MANQELDRDKRVALYHRAQEIAAENVPVIYTTLSELLSAVRNVFGNMTAHPVRALGHPLRVPNGPMTENR